MKKFLIYYSFIITGFIVVVGFVSATTFVQLATAIIFYPLFIYFALRVLPKKAHAVVIPQKPVVTIQPVDTSSGKLDEATVKLKKEGVDIDRRMFLKLIGSASLSLFLFSIFTKKAEAAFFGSAPGPGVVALKDSLGNKIDPAEKQPTDGYKITDIDDSSPAYYGFVNKDGSWFIQKEGTSGDYRYAKGSSSYSSNWTNRSSLTYGYFDNVF
jgi:hypothetical protein